MSTFQNISNGVLYVQGFLRQGDGTLGVGAQVYVEIGGTFTGSNYYKRFTYVGMIADGVTETIAANEAILLTTVDDGLPFSDHLLAPNNPLVYHSTVTGAGSVELDFATDLGSPAEFMTIETDGNISVFLNGETDARIDIDADSSYSFANGELIINSVTITNQSSGQTTSTIQTIVANSI